MEVVGFRPGGDSCGLTRSSFAIEAIIESGAEVDQGYFEDWIADVNMALGACARSCPEKGSCMASELLTSANELQEPTVHPRHSVEIRA